MIRFLAYGFRVLLPLILTGQVYGQTFSWVRTHAASGGNEAKGITSDASGNVYACGNFSGTMDFDPGAGVFNLTATAGTDAFVYKLTQSGNFVWARKFSGTSLDQSNEVFVDASGNVFIAGSFSETTDFDPGAGTVNLTSAGTVDGFIVKLNASGNFLWARQVGGASSDYANEAVVDGAGNVYICGSFWQTVDFDPGAGVYNLVSAGDGDAFALKLNSAGNFVWARRIGGTGTENSNALSMDNASNVYLSGYFENTVDFDPGAATYNLASSGSLDFFVLKLNSAGNFVWARDAGGTGIEMAFGIAADGAGNTVTVGRFAGTVDFNPGAGTTNLTSAGDPDIFISKLDASGNLVWARRIGSASYDYAYAVDLDGSGNVYTTGIVSANTDLDPGAGVVNLPGGSGACVFISKLNASGNYAWACVLGANVAASYGYDISTNSFNDILVTGHFSLTMDFNPGAGVFNVTAPSGFDLFDLRLSQPSGLPVELVSFDAQPAGTQVQCSWTTASETNNWYFTIEKSSDGLHFEEAGRVEGKGNSSDMNPYMFYDPKPYHGLSYYRLRQTDFDGTTVLLSTMAVRLEQVVNPVQLQIYPNPAKGSCIISLLTSDLTAGQICFVDLAGRMVLTQQIQPVNGQVFETLDVSSIAGGIYCVEFRSEACVIKARLVVEK